MKYSKYSNMSFYKELKTCARSHSLECYSGECLSVKWMKLFALWFLSILLFLKHSPVSHSICTWIAFKILAWIRGGQCIYCNTHVRLRLHVHLHFTFSLKPTNYLDFRLFIYTFCAIVIFFDLGIFFVHLLSKLFGFNDCCFAIFKHRESIQHPNCNENVLS